METCAREGGWRVGVGHWATNLRKLRQISDITVHHRTLKGKSETLLPGTFSLPTTPDFVRDSSTPYEYILIAMKTFVTSSRCNTN